MRLYVGNLNYDTTEDSLRELFGQDGRNVVNVSILQDRETGRSRGFGFVEMASPADGEAAMSALDGYELDGRRLRVNEARERPQRGGGGGGRSGGGGGRSGGGGYRGGGGPPRSEFGDDFGGGGGDSGGGRDKGRGRGRRRRGGGRDRGRGDKDDF